MNISALNFEWILNWIVFGPDLTFEWIFKTYRPGLLGGEGVGLQMDQVDNGQKGLKMNQKALKMDQQELNQNTPEFVLYHVEENGVVLAKLFIMAGDFT